MTPPNNDVSDRETGARVGAAVFAGALLVVLYDLAVTAWSADPAAVGLQGLLWFAPLIAIAVPSSLALLAAGIARLESTARNALGERSWITLVFDLVIASPLLALVPGLFAGPSIGASPWRWPGMAATMIAAVGGVRFLRFSVARLDRSTAGSVFARRLSLVVTLVAPITGVALAHRFTTSILPGLYEGFHRGLTLIAIGICSAACFALITASKPRLPGRRALIAAALAAAIGWPLGAIATRDEPLARQLLADHAPFTGPFSAPLFSASRLLALDLCHESSEPGTTRTSGLAEARFEDDSPRRDVLLITVDALRGDALEPGNRLGDRTASLRGVIVNGVRYSRAYSPSNYTPYSIPGLVLGYLPEPGKTPREDESIAAVFAGGGYHTELHFTAHEYASLERTAIWPLASRGFYFGRYNPAYRHAEAVLTDVATALDTVDDPIFAWAHLSDVHAPFLLRRKPGSRAGRFENSYAGQLEYLDSVLGPWLEAKLAGRRDLIWALTSDHGESLGERGRRFHGSSLFDEQVRVPLVIGGPGIEPGVVPGPVSNSNLSATLLSLAGATLPLTVRTLPLSAREVRRNDQVLIVGRRERCAVVEDQYKLIASPGQGIVALYDLERDPAEKTNLVAERAHVAQRLLDALPGLGCPFDLAGLDPTVK